MKELICKDCKYFDSGLCHIEPITTERSWYSPACRKFNLPQEIELGEGEEWD